MSEKVEELSVVFLGWHGAGKTSVINTILGSNEVSKVTGHCVKREGNINGKKVTLIDTPGWWNGNCLKDSAEFTKLELVRSLSLCPSGPHAFLLVVELNLPFTEKTLNGLEQHLEHLGDKVWDYTIVVFTKVDLVKNVTNDQRTQSEREAVKRLLEKCGDRFQVFRKVNKDKLTQITELFQKIEDMTKRNLKEKKKFEISAERLLKIQGTLESIKMNATARQLRVCEERSTIKKKAYVHRLKELKVVLLGWVMSGKSSVGNTILNKEAFKTGNRTTVCVRGYERVVGRQMTVLDTAGWWKFFPSELNPDWIKSTIFESVSQCKKFPHAILLVLPLDTSFKKEQRRIIEDNMAIFGEQVWRHTIVLFTWGDLLGDVMIEQYIEDEALQWLIEKCGNRYHVFDNTKRDDQAQVTELLEKIEEMVAANSLYRHDAPGVPETRETRPDVLLDICGKEMIEEVLEFVVMEWNRRAVKLRELERELAAEMGSTQFKSNRSLDPPPYFSPEGKSTYAAENTGPGEMGSKQKLISKISDTALNQVMSILDREWSRQEAIVMENMHTVLPRDFSETSSEVNEEEIQASVEPHVHIKN